MRLVVVAASEEYRPQFIMVNSPMGITCGGFIIRCPVGKFTPRKPTEPTHSMFPRVMLDGFGDGDNIPLVDLDPETLVENFFDDGEVW